MAGSDQSKIRIPEQIGGTRVEGAMARLEAKTAQETKEQAAVLLCGVESAISSLSRAQANLVPRPTRTVILVCLVLGALCIVSTILKSWLGAPNFTDWLILLIGLLLSGLSLFKEFKVDKSGATVVLKDAMAALQSAHAQFLEPGRDR